MIFPTSRDLINFVLVLIHSIESLSDQPTITFNVYGYTNVKVVYFNLVDLP